MTKPDIGGSGILERIASMSPEARAALEARLGQLAAASGIERQMETDPSRPAIDPSGVRPASFAQERLWFFDRLHPGSPTYNVTRLLKGNDSELRIEVLRPALQAMIDRHDILRTSFELREGEVYQRVRQNVTFEIAQTDLREELLEAELRSAVARPFDLEKDLLIRAHLYRQGNRWALLLINHHIVSDGWSARVFIRELSALYSAFSEGSSSPLPPLEQDYAGYSDIQRGSMGTPGKPSPRVGELLEFWREYLRGPLPVLNLPTDKTRPPQQSFLGEQLPLRVPAEVVSALRELSSASGVTLFMTVLAALNILLHRYCRQTDLLIGAPIAARDRVEIEQTLGYFANTLVIRNDLSADPACSELLSRVHASCIEAYAHQDMPFERLVSEVAHERNLSHSPIFQVALAWQDGRKSKINFAGHQVEASEISTGTSKFDLTFDLGEDDDGSLAGWIEYSTDLFEAATIERMSIHFQNILREMTRAPQQKISRLKLSSNEETRLILEQWAGEPDRPDSGKLIHHIFEERVAESPDAVALIYEGIRMSYAELNNAADGLAARLIAGRERLDAAGEPEGKTFDGRPVGVLMQRSPEMVAAFIACLKSGGAYLPLDPEYPKERLAYMLADGGVSQIVTTSAFRNTVPAAFGGSVILYDQAAAGAAVTEETVRAGLAHEKETVRAELSGAEHEDQVRPGGSAERAGAGRNAGGDAGKAAYVMYTSGSTGRPKGTVIPHEGVIRLVVDTGYIDFGPDQTLMHMSAPTFDAATFEIWGALLNGGKCLILPPGAHSLSYIGERLLEFGVSTLFLTVALFNAFVDEAPEKLRGIRQLLSGGSANSVKHFSAALKLLPDTRLFNIYGPTENTTFSLFYEAPRNFDPRSRSLPLGRPIKGTQAYILDENLEPVPVGIEGELYLAGSGLATGYLKAPELTADKFIRVEIAGRTESTRMYRTGDRARFLADGNIDFLGRIDQQLKIRGFRVEPGEIENVLREHEAVEEAVVISHDAGGEPDSALAAYCIVREEDPYLKQEVADYLRSRLPDYMIPASIAFLESLPLTQNGKIDHGALSAPDYDRSMGGQVAPRNQAEETMAQTWARVLNRPAVGIHDNFFELGGHSLLAVRLLSEIERESGDRIPLSAIFESPTVAGLCRRLDSSEADSLSPVATVFSSSIESSLVLIRAASSNTGSPLFMVPGGSGSEAEFLVYAGLANHLPPDCAVYGFRAKGHMAGEKPHCSVREMAAGYIADMRALIPAGPYLIGGECLGGIVAHEMARQLTEENHPVSLVVMLDTRFPARIALAVHIIRQLWQENRVRKSLGRIYRKYSIRHEAARASSATESGTPINMPNEISGSARQTSLLYPRRLLAHTPRKFEGDIVYLASEQMQGRPFIDRWKDHCAGMHLHALPGSHYSYIREHAATAGTLLGRLVAAAGEKA